MTQLIARPHTSGKDKYILLEDERGMGFYHLQTEEQGAVLHRKLGEALALLRRGRHAD